MERNIAALMRQDCRTVKVIFDQTAAEFDDFEAPPAQLRGTTQRPKAPDAKSYTYVTDLPLAVGDTVVVEARGLLTLAFVRQVDDDVKIEPSSDTQYKWVVARVDLAPYAATVEKNAELERVVAEAYRANLRRSFANQVLSVVDDVSRERITKLLGAG